MKRAVFNQKGGVGKTTIVCNLAAVAAARGMRTLVIDLDMQANATRYLLGDEPPATGIADFFAGTLNFSLSSTPFDAYITPSPFERLDVVAASSELEHLQNKLEAKQKVQKLRQALSRLRGYDQIFIDTPPALNFYSRSALIAADEVLIPFDCDDFARQALYALLENIAELREDHNEDLAIGGVVVNQFQARARLPQRMVEALKSESLPVLEPLLASSVVVRESHEAATPLPWYAPRHRMTTAFEELFTGLARRRR
ncbi:ParA family protein [Algiphilus sp.]|uniref:ParA family protein n=1 Tax=Algiphilus sp. TaxID=1872431 RepID=UPI0025C57303|nr:ParA family protein [Algiphilus sp.]MCK5770807.1 ParA family protein [Algiphilus sp.]